MRDGANHLAAGPRAKVRDCSSFPSAYVSDCCLFPSICCGDLGAAESRQQSFFSKQESFRLFLPKYLSSLTDWLDWKLCDFLSPCPVTLWSKKFLRILLFFTLKSEMFLIFLRSTNQLNGAQLVKQSAVFEKFFQECSYVTALFLAQRQHRLWLFFLWIFLHLSPGVRCIRRVLDVSLVDLCSSIDFCWDLLTSVTEWKNVLLYCYSSSCLKICFSVLLLENSCHLMSNRCRLGYSFDAN